ncbi:MAG: AsmA family protein, partial [Desulfobacterales bacterium]|nr:AsmA family protein [Desulfobacterales bacterium]
PVTISFSANADGQPVSLNGTAGPIGKQPGKGTLSFDLVLNALSDLEARLNGSVVDPAVKPVFDLNIDVASFSPRNLMSALGQPFPIETSDPKVLDAVAVRARIKGTPENLSVLDGLLTLDDSKLNFSAQAKEFGKPNLAFNLALDTIDLDRYLPLPAETKDAGAPAAEPVAEKKKTDYGPLRKLVLDGKMTADKVKAKGALVENITVHIKAKDGLISVDPMGMDLYQGNATAVVGLDVRKTEPQTSLSLNAEGIQVGPLLKDALQKELIEGMLRADLNLSMTGESPDRIKQTLNGKGGLVFNDGAIIGIDLAGMVRNVKAKLGAAVPTGEKPRTDFAELNIPFTAVNGLVNTNVTRMQSPLIRLEASGDVNLAKDLLDMRVDPKFVATLKGQGDTEDRSGLMVPLLVTGTFASPKIRPDLKGMVGLGEKGLDADTLKKQVLGSGSPADVKKELETKKEEIKDQVKGLIPGLLN